MAFEIAIPVGKQHDAGMVTLGIDLPAAYLKITAIVWHFQPEQNESGDAVKGEASFTVGLWASKAARDTGAGTLGSQTYVLRNPDLTKDLLAQCYAVLKDEGKFATLEFADAQDA